MQRIHCKKIEKFYRVSQARYSLHNWERTHKNNIQYSSKRLAGTITSQLVDKPFRGKVNSRTEQLAKFVANRLS